ncbi:hypothetical protein EDB85DRAFT_2013381 [Lactarius pseudohatsudake]|nr:hypothetical protein EDB85DRAFT_2013381 [Lactarius pseudohatsudake]
MVIVAVLVTTLRTASCRNATSHGRASPSTRTIARFFEDLEYLFATHDQSHTTKKIKVPVDKPSNRQGNCSNAIKLVRFGGHEFHGVSTPLSPQGSATARMAKT